jgi:outer membrane protein assembly factor BamE (lipoprotein component of BamABCDE complex)
MHRSAGVVLAVALAGVATAGAGEREKGKAEPPAAFTLGVVQKALRPGLSQADVAERLGSPSIVTRDADGREAWVYDKVSTEFEASSGSLGVGGLGSGTGGSFWGLLGVGAGKRSEKARSSQKTLTVVIRFSAAGSVETFTWHASRF